MEQTRLTGMSLLVLALLSGAAHAVEYNALRPDQSRVDFAYKQMNAPMEGKFKRIGGQIRFDPAKPLQAKANLDIDLASIDTGTPDGDEEVAGKLWFNTAQYPIARFVSASVKPLGNNRFLINGNISIKGKTRPIGTTATFIPQGAQRGVFEGSFVLKRADFGIGEGMWADFGTVANEVQIKYRLVATSAGAK